MDRDEALEILAEVVREDKHHQDYERTVDVASKCYRLVTGDGLEDDLKKFTQRETDEMFQQRKDITKHIVPTVVKNLVDVQNKVPRSNSLTRVIKYKGDEENEKVKDLEDILGGFWGNKSFDDYMGVRFIELNNIDPNAFVVAEFKDFDPINDHLKPYPFEVKSDMAVMYEYDNNVLQYLISKNTVNRIYGTKPNVLKKILAFFFKNKDLRRVEEVRHTMYLPERAIVLDRISDPETVKSLNIPEYDTWIIRGGKTYIRFETKRDYVYVLEEPEPYNLEEVPAARVGYKRDMTTDGRTYVSPYWDTIPLLEKTIKANSELDLTMCLHAFPQKIITGSKCDNENCLMGKIYNENTGVYEICPQCKGVGMLPHTSSQDVVIVDLPQAKEEQLSLDNIVRYIYPPVDLIQFQDEYIENLTWKVKQTMFNSDIFTKQEVSETATGKNIDLQNVYDTLWPLAVKYADFWEFFVNTIAQLTDMDKDLVALFTFDKDFKMKTTSELYADLQKANESGADSFAKQDIQQDIARNIFANNPEEFRKYLVQQSFYPFAGKSKEEIIAIKTTQNTTRFNKVLNDNFSQVFDLIEMEDAQFYIKDRKKQWEKIQGVVAKLIEEIDTQTTQTLEGDTIGTE